MAMGTWACPWICMRLSPNGHSSFREFVLTYARCWSKPAVAQACLACLVYRNGLPETIFAWGAAPHSQAAFQKNSEGSVEAGAPHAWGSCCRGCQEGQGCIASHGPPSATDTHEITREASQVPGHQTGQHHGNMQRHYGASSPPNFSQWWGPRQQTSSHWWGKVGSKLPGGWCLVLQHRGSMDTL